MKKVMFVCTGNICRSAMADGIFKKLVQDNKKDIKVYSSGIYAQTGDRADINAIDAVRDYDVNLSCHKATNIYDAKMNEMDLILGMTNSHKIELISRFPDLKERIFTLSEYIGEKDEISDPWGDSIFTFRKCATKIYNYLEKLIEIV